MNSSSMDYQQSSNPPTCRDKCPPAQRSRGRDRFWSKYSFCTPSSGLVYHWQRPQESLCTRSPGKLFYCKSQNLNITVVIAMTITLFKQSPCFDVWQHFMELFYPQNWACWDLRHFSISSRKIIDCKFDWERLTIKRSQELLLLMIFLP